jgi:hypothetical protein
MEQNKLDKIKQGLYSRSDKILNLNKRHGLQPDMSKAPTAWDDSDKPIIDNIPPVIESNNQMSTSKPTSMAVKIFIGSILFCVFAIGIALFNFFGGSSFVSGDKVDIYVTGPTSVSAGDPMTFSVVVKNNNSTDLQATDLSLEYPDGTREVNDQTKEIKRVLGLLGTDGVVPAGSLVEKNYKAVLYGSEAEKKTIKVSVEYRVKGSNAVFHKEKDYDVLISSSPISVNISANEKITSGQNLDFTVEVKSNSRQVLRGVLLQSVFPTGFTFKTSLPSAFSRNIWNLGDLEVGAVRKIKISGVLSGQDGEERIFKFTVGSHSQADESVIATNFVAISKSIILERPFIGTVLSIDGDTGVNIVTRPNKLLRADLSWTNNLPGKLTNAEIVVKFNGNMIDKNSVSANDGFYRSSDNTITFSPETMTGLDEMSSGDERHISFSFSLIVPAGSTKQEMTIDVSAKALRDDNNSIDQVTMLGVKKIKIGSNLSLTATNSYKTGPFVNTGPIPPKADTETTYTITWSLINSDNDIDGVTVSAILPSYVKWTGSVSPQGEDITYNQETGYVIWTAGKVPAGTGKTSAPRTASFQIAFSPSISQIGQYPVLLKESVVRGIDNFAGTQIFFNISSLTTALTVEAAAGQATGQVGD